MTSSSASPLGAGQRLPSGPVTFLFTDIEGSDSPAAGAGRQIYRPARRPPSDASQRSSRGAPRDRGGHRGRLVPSSPSRVPSMPSSAVVDLSTGAGRPPLARRRHGARAHGPAHRRAGDQRRGEFVGIDVHRAARIAAAAHGGQVLLSQINLAT